MQKILLALAFVAVAFAGCVDEGEAPVDDVPETVYDDEIVPNTDVESLVVSAQELNLTPITLEESVVSVPQLEQTHDPYEPTMDVCDDGSIYITGHTFLVDTTGAPVFGSSDDGASWYQLPWFQDQVLPGGVPGSSPPVTDEIFLACGDDGWLYGGDITLASYPVNAWSGYGSKHEYWNFNAYNEADNAQQATECSTLGVVPAPAPAKDRPWTAYNNGTLLLTSNPAGGANQIGAVSVPFASPSPVSYGTVVDGIDWNLCAGPGGSIPGVPDINSQGLFAAPQKSGGNLYVTIGHASDVMDVRNVPVFPISSGGEITSHYGHVTFDADDTMFVGISANKDGVKTNEDGSNTTIRVGQMRFAVSMDDGETFQVLDFETGEGNLRHFYMDANRFGSGALVTWAVNGQEGGFDWYMAHLQANETGVPYLENAFLVIDEGPMPSAHVTGAAVGPDGRAYTATYIRGTAHLSVWIQRDGPTLPVYADVETVTIAAP